MPFDRRSFIKGAGVTAGAALLAGTGAARIDDAIDLDGGRQEVIVVFEDRADADVLSRFDLPDGYHVFDVLPYAYTRASGAVIEEIAALESVRWIDKNHEIELHNDDARELTGAAAVHSDLDVSGEGVHVAMIDSGLSPHPDLVEKIEHNFKYANPLSDKTDDANWIDAGPADVDDIGHGTHVAGTFGGTGEASDDEGYEYGQYAGMAPDVEKITSFRVDGPTGLFLHVVSALDRLLAMQRDGEVDVQLINNSWGWSRWGDFNPTNAVNMAFWRVFEEGMLPVFSAGNDADFDTLSPYARAPYVLTVAATHSGDFGEPKTLTDFSSQGRPPEEATDPGGYAENYELDYDDSEGAQYDRRPALRNVQRFYADDPTDAPVVDPDQYVTEITSDIPAAVRPPLSSAVRVQEAETVEWESPAEAGLLRATMTWEPRHQSVEVEVYPTDDPDNAIGGPYPANINDGRAVIEFDVPIEPETSYTFEFRGQNNVHAEATVEIEVLEDVSEVDGPFGVYRPSVGAPGDNVVSTLPPSNVLWPLVPAIQEGAQPTEPLYDALSGTSMSCPVVTGIGALVYAAYRERAGFFPKPVDVLNIVEATAEGGTGAELDSHHEANIGAGFVDAEAAVRLARELGERAADRNDLPGRGTPDDPGRDRSGADQRSDARPGSPGEADSPGRPARDDPSVPRHPELWDQVELCTYEGE